MGNVYILSPCYGGNRGRIKKMDNIVETICLTVAFVAFVIGFVIILKD